MLTYIYFFWPQVYRPIGPWGPLQELVRYMTYVTTVIFNSVPSKIDLHCIVHEL